MNTKEFKSQSGVSLIEVLVVLAIMAIIVGFAVAQFGDSKDNFQRQNIARELKVNLERARFDSVKRRPDDGNDNEKSKVIIESDTSFSVHLDFNQDGVISVSEKRLIDFGYMDGIKIVGDDLIFPITVKFDRRGHITVDGTGSNIKPSFIVCDKGCTSDTATNENSNQVSISSTGTITMTGGGETDTIFNNPTISTVGRCDNINDFVTVGSSSTATLGCSPTPTPSPTASPTASPSGSPVPNACTSGQKPSVNNCTCYLPMTVRTNGKCI